MDGERFQELRAKLDSCDGQRIYRQILAHRAIVNVFLSNGQELRAATAAFQDPRVSVELMQLTNRDKLGAYLHQTTRLLHNWLASARTLVDVSRVISRRLYSSHAFRETYDSRVRESFSTSAVVKFVHGLRNYSLHHDVPIASATITFEREGNKVSSELALDLSDLRKSQEFDGLALEYLVKFKDRIPISTLVTDYQSAVFDFHKRAIEGHQTQFKAELAELKNILDEIRVPLDVG